MSLGIDSLLDISKRALYTQSQSIRIIGNNIANVNTEGYSKRKAEIVSTDAVDITQGSFGTGADIEKVVRCVDSFLNSEMMDRINDRSEAEIKDEFLSRAEATFSVDTESGRIGYEMSKFFSALEDLQASPSSIALRSAVVEQGQSLCDTISSTYQVVADLQREADDRLKVLVGNVNQLSSEIADLNSQIVAGEVGSQENLTLRDQRDQLLNDMSELISVNTIENSNGSVTVTLEDGFALVSGNDTNELEYTQSPTFADADGYPVGLDGGNLGFIVHDFDDTATGQSHIDLTTTIAAGGGEIAGLLNLRGIQHTDDTSPFDASGDLVEVASYVESIARDLLTRFNTAYLGTDGDTSTAIHEATSGDLEGNLSNTFVVNGSGNTVPTNTFALFSFTGANNSSTGGADVDCDGIPSQQDLEDFGLFSYANDLQFNISNPAKFAAALDLDSDPATSEFTAGDGQNIANLLNEQTKTTTYTLGTVNATGTIEEMYDLSVSFVGGLKSTASNQLYIAQDRETQVQEAVSTISGVSLDEEFAQLITFQKAYQAAARMIKVGDELLSEIIELVG